jgi:hypothetical protein
MSVEHVEVLVEEPSMETALRHLLPRILGDVSFEVYSHQGKDELLQHLPGRLRGYAAWLPPTHKVVVVVDRDDDDCATLKRRLERIAAEAGLRTRTVRPGAFAVVNRIAIEELEAWYFGDWEAVLRAYPKASKSVPMQANYRDPDGIVGGTWEALERILQKHGYFPGGLTKIALAREVAAHMDPARNRSRSFQVFSAALREFANA